MKENGLKHEGILKKAGRDAIIKNINRPIKKPYPRKTDKVFIVLSFY